MAKDLGEPGIRRRTTPGGKQRRGTEKTERRADGAPRPDHPGMKNLRPGPKKSNDGAGPVGKMDPTVVARFMETGEAAQPRDASGEALPSLETIQETMHRAQHSKSEKERLRARRRVVYWMRQQGMPFEQIAKAVGVPGPSHAWKIFDAACRERERTRAENLQHSVQLDIDRCERWIQSLMPDTLGGEDVDARDKRASIETSLKVLNKKHELQGASAMDQHKINKKDGEDKTLTVRWRMSSEARTGGLPPSADRMDAVMEIIARTKGGKRSIDAPAGAPHDGLPAAGREVHAQYRVEDEEDRAIDLEGL